MKQKLIIKIGTSLVSNGDILIMDRIKELCEFIVTLRQKFQVILVSSGAVASGYTRLRLDKSRLENKQALASIGQPLLMEAYHRFLEPYGVVSSQYLLTGSVFNSTKCVANTKDVIDILLSNDVLPIVNENDPIAQNDLTFGDNDQLSARVTHFFDAPMLLILSDVYGYFDSNPLENENANLIKYVSSIRRNTITAEKKAGSKFATGGIVTKLMAADFLLKHDRKMFLCSGFDLKASLDFLLENKHNYGTLFSKEQGIEI